MTKKILSAILAVVMIIGIIPSGIIPAMALSTTDSAFTDNYLQLKYISNGQGQYINTDYKAGAGVTVSMDLMITSWVKNYSAIFGSRTGNHNSNSFVLCRNNAKNELRSEMGNAQYTYPQVTLNNRSDVSISGTSNFSGTGLDLFLFGLNQNGSLENTYKYATFNLYSCKIQDNGTVVRDFVPAQRKSDGANGLFDLQNGEFYQSASGTNFNAGPEHHHFTYSASGANLMATCVAGCESGFDERPLTLSLTEDGIDETALGIWSGFGLAKPKIDYYSVNDLETSLGGTKAEACKVAGDYIVKATVGIGENAVTAEKEFTLSDILIPTAITGLTYDGTTKTGVAEGEGYTLEKNTATDAGTYTAIAKLKDGYIWSDGTTESKNIEWKIDPLTRDWKDMTWTAVSSWPTKEGKYYLYEDITINEREFVIRNSDIYLDLNGHTVTFAYTGNEQKSAISLVESNFYLYDSVGGGTITRTGNSNYDRALWIETNTTFNMYGGTISGFTAGPNNGGGVYLWYNSTFNMYGGTIANCTAVVGGGLYSEGGTLNMHGGNIRDNSAEQAGGGVGIGAYGKFNMYDGDICRNKETQFNYDDSLYAGGGVVVWQDNSEFTMYGGAIHNNYAVRDGGGVGVLTGTPTFTMYGGEIYENESLECGGAVSACAGQFDLHGGVITQNTGKWVGGLYCHGSLAFTMSGGIVSNNISNGTCGGVLIKNDVTAVLTGGSIIGNKGPYAGLATEQGSFNITLGGNLVVKDNTNADNQLKNLCNNGATAGVIVLGTDAAAPKEGMCVGMSQNHVIKNVSDPYAVNYFFADDSSLYVKHNESASLLELAQIEEGANRITIPEWVGGSVLCDRQYAKQGDTVKLKAVSNEGYTVSNIKCNGEEVQKIGENVYQFTMPNKEAAITVNSIPVPTAKTGLVYNGEEQTGVAEGEGYTLENNTATDAGTYTAIAKLKDGYVWEDEDFDGEIEWTIAKSEDADLFEIIKKHLEENSTEVGGLMGRQGLRNKEAGTVSESVGRTIIGLTAEQLENAGDKLIIVGSDGNKQVNVTVDCVYTYFYNGNTKVEATGLKDGNGGNIVAFAIIDNNGSGEDITGYGYYRVYSESLDNFMFDVLYAAPEKK